MSATIIKKDRAFSTITIPFLAFGEEDSMPIPSKPGCLREQLNFCNTIDLFSSGFTHLFCELYFSDLLSRHSYEVLQVICIPNTYLFVRLIHKNYLHVPAVDSLQK